MQPNLPQRQLGDLMFVPRTVARLLANHRLDVVVEFAEPFLRAVRQQNRLLNHAQLLTNRFSRFFPFALLRGKFFACCHAAHRHRLARLQGGKECAQPEIILLQNGIELVVVAARTLDAHRKEHVAGHVSDVVENIAPLRFHIALVVLINPMAQIHCGRERLAIGGVDFIAGDLLAYKSVVRLVGIERVDDVIAIAPRLRPEMVGVVAVGIRVAHEVQPKPRLPFAKARAGQQPVDERCVCGIPICV